MIPLAISSFWATFPWGSVGAVGVVVGFIIGALKLAVMFGTEKQRGVDHERRLLTLEGKADGVPDEVDHEVSQRYHAVESEATALRRHLSRAIADLRRYGQNIDHLKWRCETNHGEFSKVTSVREDSDELLMLEPPKAEGDKP